MLHVGHDLVLHVQPLGALLLRLLPLIVQLGLVVADFLQSPDRERKRNERGSVKLK